jgi:hypothetical protein
VVLQLPGGGGIGGEELTLNNFNPSSFWRGTMVTSSISQMKAISGGVSPGGRGNAIVELVM